MGTGSWDGWTGVVLTAVGLGLTVWALPRQVPKTRIQWVFWQVSSLVALPEGSLITVTVDGRPVANAWLITIRISNTGRQPIAQADWNAPIEVIFEKGASPVSAHISAVNPRGLNPLVSIKGNVVSLEPTLLNMGDMFELQVVGEGPASIPTVTSRIRGIPDIRRRRKPYNPGSGAEGEIITSDLMVYGLFGVLVAGLTIMIVLNWSPWLVQGILLLIGFWLLIVATALFLIGARRRRALWRPTYVLRK